MRRFLQSPPFAGLGVFRYGVYFSFANALAWMILLGTPMVLLAEQLGATPFQVGLLYSSAFLMLPVQVAATGLLPHLGFKRQMLLGWGSRSIFILVPIGIALVRPEERGGALLQLYILSVFAFCFLRSIGAAALVPWLYDILPEDRRGRYFGTDSLVVGMAGIITLVSSSVLFNVLSAYSAFALLFGMTLFAAVCSVLCITKLPDGVRPQIIGFRHLMQRAAALCFEKSGFRRHLRLQILYAGVGFAFVPFSVFYLRAELGLSQSYILTLTAIQFFGMTAASFVVKEWVDRIGAKPFFVLSHVATVSFQLCWIVIVALPNRFEAALPLVYLLVGFAMAAFGTANFKYLPQVCDSKERALAVSVFSAVVGFIGGLASTLWGLILKDPSTGGMDQDAFVAYFAFALVAQSYLLYAYARLEELRPSVQSLPARGWLARPFRYLINFINLVEPRDKPSPPHRQ